MEVAEEVVVEGGCSLLMVVVAVAAAEACPQPFSLGREFL